MDVLLILFLNDVFLVNELSLTIFIHFRTSSPGAGAVGVPPSSSSSSSSHQSISQQIDSTLIYHQRQHQQQMQHAGQYHQQQQVYIDQ